MSKTAIITGATSGIGYQIALILAEKEYNLLLVSRNKEKLESIKLNFEKTYKVEVDYFVSDLYEKHESKNVFDYAISKKLNIDILVNNSGYGLYGEHTDSSLDKINNMLNLNIIALTELCGYFGNYMKQNNSGKILNVASVAAYQPTPYFAAYGASKSYVLNFSEALAKELEDYNVSVTCLSPGATKTEFFTVAEVGDISGQMSEKNRMSAKKVAEIGVNAMFNKKLSVIPGFKNSFLAFSNRFAPRILVANISKKIMNKG